MKKRRNTKRKKIDIYQKSFSFTHRYNKEKFVFEKIQSLKSNFDLKINNRLILSAIVFSSLFLAVTIKMIMSMDLAYGLRKMAISHLLLIQNKLYLFRKHGKMVALLLSREFKIGGLIVLIQALQSYLD